MPAIVDHAPADGGAPLSVFESGAILLYLAGKTGRFLPTDLRGRTATLEWLFWQMAGLGPMTGQYGHFHVYAPEPIEYARTRYAREANRLLGVLDRRLAGAPRRRRQCTIADMAIYPWIRVYDKAPIDMALPGCGAGAAIRAQPATRACALANQVSPDAGKPRGTSRRTAVQDRAEAVKR